MHNFRLKKLFNWFKFFRRVGYSSKIFQTCSVVHPKFSEHVTPPSPLPNRHHQRNGIFFRSSHQSLFKRSRKGPKISTHLPVDSQMVLKSSNHCRTDISQPYSDNFCWQFRWVPEELGDTQFHPCQKCSRCKVSVCLCHEFGRRWFFSWHNVLINCFAYISSILFFVFEIVFSHSLQHMQKCRLSIPAPGLGSSMASYHQKPLGLWTYWILYLDIVVLCFES